MSADTKLDTKTINDGGQAFPQVVPILQVDDNCGARVMCTKQTGGMTLRDYLAAHAPDHCANFVPAGWKFSEPRPVKPEGYDYWAKGGSAPQSKEQLAACQSYDNECGMWEHRRSAACLIAGRWGYADSMLAARES